MNINITATAGKPPSPNNKSTTIDHSTLEDAATLPPTQTQTSSTAAATSSKTLKRCLSVPIIHTLPGAPPPAGTIPTMTTRSAAAAAAAVANYSGNSATEIRHETPKKYQTPAPDSSMMGNFGHNIHIGIPRSNPSSREVSPAPVFNIFGTRARRYSASYSPLGAAVAAAGGGPATGAGGAPLCITPRVSQLRQEECVDMNSREVNHEREVHSAMQMSQSWEDLTLVAENWSCKSDEFSNPLQVVLPSSMTSCSSPSPTNNRAGLRLPYGLSPSPTRRTFATRRSMSPIAMRPSQLGPVKRKFELDDNTSSNWNVYSPPPLKKIFTESRGSSPVAVGQSPTSVPSPADSGTYDGGRITPKLFISKLCTTNTNNNNSACSSPMSASPSNSISGAGAIDSTATSTLCSSSSSSSSYASSISGGSEPMCIGSNIDEGISISEVDEKPQCERASTTTRTTAAHGMSTDIQDDDMKSETSSIGGCSSISIESSSCDSGAKAAATFLNKLNADDIVNVSSSLGQKNFFMTHNKQGRGAKKFIVNHDNLPNSTSFDGKATTTNESNQAEAIVENKM